MESLVSKHQFKSEKYSYLDEDVKLHFLESTIQIPLVLEQGIKKNVLKDSVFFNHSWMEEQLSKYGALLFRGFQFKSTEILERFVSNFFHVLTFENNDVLQILGSSNALLWSNKDSYKFRWPLRLGICCMSPGKEEGEISLVDSRQVYSKLDIQLRNRFLERGILYEMNYLNDTGPKSWQYAFQTEDPKVAEEICKSSRVKYEWKSDGRLRVTSLQNAATKHPKTGEMCWFNQVLSWKHTNENNANDALVELQSEEYLSQNCFYGDGTPIEDSVIKEIHDVYSQLAFSFPLNKDDVLILDNMLVSQGWNLSKGRQRHLSFTGQLMSHDELASFHRHSHLYVNH